MVRGRIASEGLSIIFEKKEWGDIHGITLCCAILNEEENLQSFIDWHKPYVDNIVAVDGGSIDNSFSIASKNGASTKIVKFSGHYGNQKNRAIELSMNDWVLFLDPDERLSKEAMAELRKLIDQDEVDCYSFPRHNFVDEFQDISHGSDHQDRLFRSYCRYVRPTHEELVGYKSKKVIDDTSAFFIDHRKKGDRHVLRNSHYHMFDYVFLREFGAPGSQKKESFEKHFTYPVFE